MAWTQLWYLLWKLKLLRFCDRSGKKNCAAELLLCLVDRMHEKIPPVSKSVSRLALRVPLSCIRSLLYHSTSFSVFQAPLFRKVKICRKKQPHPKVRLKTTTYLIGIFLIVDEELLVEQFQKIEKLLLFAPV